MSKVPLYRSVLLSSLGLASVASMGNFLLGESPKADPPEFRSTDLANMAKPQEIPLKEIWAHMMPGTRKIRDLEGKPLDENSMMAVIGRIHVHRRKEKAKPAFVVHGEGLEGLREAMYVITEQKPRPTALKEGKRISIVFFTHTSGVYVHLVKVEVEKNTIRVRYKMTPHRTKDLTQHFALIPLGVLQKGKFKVDVIAEPMEKKLIQDGFMEIDDERKSRIVSPSFEFEIT